MRIMAAITVEQSGHWRILVVSLPTELWTKDSFHTEHPHVCAISPLQGHQRCPCDSLKALVKLS